MKLVVGALALTAVFTFADQPLAEGDESSAGLGSKLIGQAVVPLSGKELPLYMLAFQDCSAVLVKNTVSTSTFSISDLSIALTMSENTWNDLHQQLGAVATVYGIPLGASYDNYEKTVRSVMETFQLNNFQLYAGSYSSSKLSDRPDLFEAYRACLAANSHGLAVVAGTMGNTADSSYSIWVTWSPPPETKPGKGYVTNTSNLDTQSDKNIKEEIAKANLPLRLKQGGLLRS